MPVNTDIQQQVFDLLTRASTLSFVSAETETTGQLGLVPGQRVTAEVLSLLSGQRVQIRAGSELFNLELPMKVRVGQSLELTFVSDSPRTTFAIARPGGVAQPVSLSDASRLLGLLVGNEQLDDPQVRSSLHGIGDLLRRSSGEAGVLANLMDEALTYGGGGETRAVPLRISGESAPSPDEKLSQTIASVPTPERARLVSFETNASQMLQHIARTSRFLLTEAVNPPVTPLPLMPGDEVDAAVLGTLPGGRAFVQVAGATLELQLSRAVAEGEILRLTYISSQPKPLFALARSAQATETGALSEAGRWLSVLEHNAGGASSQQMYVLDRLNTILKNLPPDSPAFTAIMDEAITYQSLVQSGEPAGELHQAPSGTAVVSPQQPTLQPGSGIILNDDMAKLLQALIKGDRLTLLEALGQQAVPPGIIPGQQLKAEVLSMLGGGRFMVQVAGEMLEFGMPKGTQRGDVVTLFFITADPKPTFLATRFGRPGDSRVSDTGRWLSSFLGAAAEQAAAPRTGGLLQTLLEGQPRDARQVSSMLQQGLRESGLFYESHLARWFGGDFKLSDILREPQGRLSDLKQPVLSQAQDSTPGEEHVSVPLKANSLEVMEVAFKKAGSSSSPEGIADQRALPVVREQLDALQSGQVLFRGELFSGQPMEWSVREREARRTSDGDQERNWETTIQLDLPHLGSIAARLVLEGDRITIDLRAGDAAGAELLTNGRPELVEQLQAAGLIPGEIGVRHEA